jgi:anhydro-N-acetylmuramic acid kinase
VTDDNRIFTAVGLMSGTSMDGIDAALIRTDGRGVVEPLGFLTRPYDDDMRVALRACLGAGPDDAARGPHIAKTAERLTRLHADIVADLRAACGAAGQDVDLIGFHGHTIAHDPHAADPARRFTRQIGDGALLARLTGVDVTADFRSADVAAGGEGAPLVPLYHQALALAAGLPRPCAVLNIGGVANITWLGEGEDEVSAGDVGPGNALIDDWVERCTGKRFDDGGGLAATGKVCDSVLKALLAHRFFDRSLPKSLDRQDFSATVAACGVEKLSPADGAATLTAFTAAAAARVLEHVPAPPRRLLVCGGGRLNATLMNMLAARFAAPVDPVEAVGWNGDALEAQAFAHLAVRSRLGLPLSLPGTTGVARPLTGGRFFPAKTKA